MKRFDITGAERIGVPKGDDKNPCADAFQEATGIEIPDFNDRKLTASSQGIEFFSLKGKDIPGLVATGQLDAGTTGSDSIESSGFSQGLQSRRIGGAMCRFLLLGEADKADGLRVRLEAPQWVTMMPVATPLPEALNRFAAFGDLPIKAVDLPDGVTLSGSMEIMPRLLEGMGVELVADRVSSGRTARENGLVELMPIMDIYPALVQRTE